MKIIALNEFSENRKFLTGLIGKKILSRLIDSISREENPNPLFLNFSGLVATGSFFNQAILPLRDYCIARKLNLYPVIANVEEETLEEIKLLFEMIADVLLLCDINVGGNITEKRWVGVLEEKQLITYNAVLLERETDAPTLARKYPEEGIGATGWNNRLSALAAKGLLMEISKGRNKSYMPVMEM
jgi:hypothetical protein